MLKAYACISSAGTNTTRPKTRTHIAAPRADVMATRVAELTCSLLVVVESMLRVASLMRCVCTGIE